MKFGVIYDFRNPPQPEFFEPWPEFYAGTLEHIEEMEHLGFHAGVSPNITATRTATIRVSR